MQCVEWNERNENGMFHEFFKIHVIVMSYSLTFYLSNMLIITLRTRIVFFLNFGCIKESNKLNGTMAPDVLWLFKFINRATL